MQTIHGYFLPLVEAENLHYSVARNEPIGEIDRFNWFKLD